MKHTFIKAISLFLAVLLFLLGTVCVSAKGEGEGASGEGMALPCVSAILMDAKTGRVLYEQNADAALPPASVTKIMTLLLVMEALDSGRISLTDEVSVSARAASMGGSQVYLKEGERMTVEEMLKCVIIASANDCAVALAEFVSGSEEGFVAAMNARAAELGMVNTHFENTNGLDDTATGHLTSARDIALMSAALISHPKILEYSGIWMDTIRNGNFGLTNTNRLVRFYPGCTGLKTGSTAKAKFCISATAEREGLSLICVIMAAETRDIRNAAAAKLLDYGFANYAAYNAQGEQMNLPVLGGVAPDCTVRYDTFCATVPKGESGKVTAEAELPDTLRAPIAAGEQVGRMVYRLNGEEVGAVPIFAAQDVGKMDIATLFCRMLAKFLLI